MDSELKQYLDGMETRMRAQTEGAEIRLREHVSAECEKVRLDLREHTEAVETRLLGEFWKWARTADIRYRQATSVVGALDDRVQAIEDRVAELERRPRT